MYSFDFDISNFVPQIQTGKLYHCDVAGRKQLSDTGERRRGKVGKKGIRPVG